MTAKSPAVANPFTSDTIRMQFRSHNSKAASGATAQHQRSPFGGRFESPQLSSVTGRHNAKISRSKSFESFKAVSGQVKDGDTVGSQAVVRDIREIPDTNMPGNFSWGSYITSPLSYSPSSPNVSKRTRHRSMSSPTTPYVLPETAKVSPLTQDAPHRRNSPVSEIQDLGWGMFRDDDEENQENKERKESNLNLFPGITYTPKVPLQGINARKVKAKGSGFHAKAPSSPPQSLPSVRPPQHSRQTPVRVNASDTKKETSIADLYRNAKQIYAMGPKGEGQKAWESMRSLREHRKRQELELANLRKREAMEQQAANVHAAAIAHILKLEAGKKAAEAGTGEPADSVSTGESRGKGTGIEPPDARKGSDATTTSCLTVPVGASRSVQYDAKEVSIDRSNKPLPRVPNLDPAPWVRTPVRSNRSSRSSKISDGGLPSPPEPLSRPQVVATVRDISQPHEKKDNTKKGNGWLARALDSIFDVESETNFSSSHKTHADHAAKRKQEKLKASISQPVPVDGHDAAVSFSPSVVRPLELQQYNAKKDKGKGKAKRQPPPLPPPPPVPHRPEPKRSSADGKEKKEKGTVWLNWFPSHEGGKSFQHGFPKWDSSLGNGRKRAGSDISWVCQGIGSQDFAYADAHQTSPYRGQRVPSARDYQDPGSSRQKDPRVYDATLVPEPLYTGGREAETARVDARAVSKSPVRDTQYYTLYDDVLREYAN